MLNWFGSSSPTRVPLTLKELEGEWQIVSVGKDGNRAPSLLTWLVDIRFRINGDQYTSTAGGEIVEQGRLQLQPQPYVNDTDLFHNAQTWDDQNFINRKILPYHRTLATKSRRHLERTRS